MINRPILASAMAATLSIAVSATALPAFAKSNIRAAAAPVATANLAAPVVFAHGNTTLFNPDGIVVTQSYVFVAYQGSSDSSPTPSTIVKYDHAGKILGSVKLTGRCDGLRLNPTTKLLWALLNNDGLNGSSKRQPLLYTIDPKTLTTSLYQFPAIQPHGGGYDDMAFINGQAFLSASSPTLNAQGVNDKPVVVAASLTNAGRVKIAPIFNGNSPGFNANTKQYGPLNFSDPDSLAVDSSNDLVVVGDSNQQILILKNPGQIGAQKAVVYTYGTQFDDVAWSTGTSGTLFVADPVQNAIYTVAATYPAGAVFGESGTGIPVQSFIGTIGAGEVVTPLLTQRNGVFGPSSLIFVPAGGIKDGI